MRTKHRVATLACVLLGACASGGSTRQRATTPGEPGVLSIDVGLATLTDLETKGRRVLERNRYVVVRTTPAPDVTYETAWLTRAPLADEHTAEITAAQSRITLRARQRNYTGGGGDTWQVTLNVETQVRRSGNPDFQPTPVSGEFERFARRLAGELKTLFETGIRKP